LNINADLKLPSVSPSWLNVAIGLLLSIGNNDDLCRRPPPPLPSNAPPLLFAIWTFLDEWSSASGRSIYSSNINISLPNDQPEDPLQQSTFILEQILIPLLDCNLIVNKIHSCKSCQRSVTLRITIPSIPISVLRTGLNLERELQSFFAPTISDLLCSLCGNATIRHIEVIQWPQVLIININDSEANARFRKPPGALSLVQFSNWLAIRCPSSNVYNLTCFNSIVRSGANNCLVRVTKIKKSWGTSVNKRVIGEGEQLRRLYANSRKYKYLFFSIYEDAKFCYASSDTWRAL
jgi:hypothetical protein